MVDGLQIETNADQVAEAYEARLEIYRATLEERFASTGRRVNDWIRDNQFSGRPPGLNIVTGNLHDSLHDVITVDRGMFSVESEVYNRGAPYWYYHEFPEGDRAQYLRINEFYQEKAREWYENDVKEAIEVLTK